MVERTILPLRKISHLLDLIPTELRQVLFASFLLIDGYLGVILNTGVIRLSGFFSGQLVWLVLLIEMMAGFLVFIRLILNYSKPKWKSAVIVSTPLIVALTCFVVLELILTGLGKSATMIFNLSSIGLSGLYWAAVYLSIAIGLTLTYKVQRFANFAQAEMMLFGAYVALILMWSDTFFPISNAPKDGVLNWELLIWAGISSFLLTGFLGLFIDKFVYRKLRDKMATAQVMMIASLGVSMILRALLFMRFGAGTFRFIPDRDWRLATSTFEIPTQRLQLHLGEHVSAPLMNLAGSVNPYGFAYSKAAMVIGIFLVVLLMLILLHRTRLGRQIRAVADNPDLAASSGIHVERVHSSSAFLSAGIAGFGGALLAAILPINPMLGLTLLLPAFAVIVLGSVGSMAGVIIAGLIVGLLRALSEPILIGAGNALDRPTASGFAEVTPFIFLIGLLLLAPKGIGYAVQNWNIERIRKGRLTRLTADRSTAITNRRPVYWLAALTAHVCIWIDKWNEKKDQAIAFLKNKIAILYSLTNNFLTRLFTMMKSTYRRRPAIPLKLRSLRNNWTRVDPKTERGSWIMFCVFFLILIFIVWLLPSVSNLTKTLQVARIVTLVGIFGLAAFSLNLHTGVTGMTNFGVIFFIGIGAVFVGLLSAPVATNGYGWSPLSATIAAVLLSATLGWLLAYPTARLRMDYFAVVTIALGEMLRISLQAEPLLRAGTVTSAIGISQYPRPFENWWKGGPGDLMGNLLGLDGGAPYVVLLAIMATVLVIAVWFLLDTILSSPWGRILRSIREDEVVTQHHGHNILTHKAASLALGAAIAALAGALWAWLNTNVWPDFMNPVRSTFLIWAAFIVGGRGNNKGMIIGAFLIVIVEFVFNVMVVSRGGADLAFHNLTSYLDSAFSWIVVDIGGLIWSDRSIYEVFSKENVILSLSHLKLALIGTVIVTALLMSSKGLLPEIPSRPERPEGLEADRQGNEGHK